MDITDEEWDVMCQPLAIHPVVERLYLGGTLVHEKDEDDSHYEEMSDASKTHRMQHLVEMLKVNTIMSNTTMDDEERDEASGLMKSSHVSL
jgi:hypothetical protein